MCRLKRNSRPPPNWPISSVVLPECSVRSIDERKLAFPRFRGPFDFRSDKPVALATTPNRADPRPSIGRKTRARNRITQGKCPQDRADHAAIGGLFAKKDFVLRGCESMSNPLRSALKPKPLDSDAEIAGKEVLDVDASAPGVIVSQVSIKGSENGLSLAGALNRDRSSRDWERTPCP